MSGLIMITWAPAQSPSCSAREAPGHTPPGECSAAEPWSRFCRPAVHGSDTHSSNHCSTYLLALLHHAAARGADLLGDLLAGSLGICLLDLLGDQLALLHGPLLALLPDVDHVLVSVLVVEVRSEALARPEVAAGQLERVTRLIVVTVGLAAAAEHGARGDGDWQQEMCRHQQVRNVSVRVICSNFTVYGCTVHENIDIGIFQWKFGISKFFYIKTMTYL